MYFVILILLFKIIICFGDLSYLEGTCLNYFLRRFEQDTVDIKLQKEMELSEHNSLVSTNKLSAQQVYDIGVTCVEKKQNYP